VAIDREKSLATAQKYVEKRRYDRAVIEYQKILQEDPSDARTLLKLGDLQSKMEAYAEAIATYERVGKFYATQGFALKAVAVYKQIREIIAKHVPQLDDQYAHVTPKLADLYEQLGLTSDALAALDDVVAHLQRQKRPQEAIDVFRRIVELDPTNPLTHLRLAEALSQAKNIDEAVAEFGVAAGQLLRLGRRDDVLRVTERMLQLNPDPVHARLAAELYLARGNANDGLHALAKLQICFQANPSDLDTLGLLARAFTLIGQAAKAIEVHKEMARIARESGKSELFCEIVAKLQKLAPNDEVVKHLAAQAVVVAEESASASRADAADGHDGDLAEETYEDVVDGDIESEEQPIDLAKRAARAFSGAGIDTTLDGVEAAGDDASANGHAPVARVLAAAAAFRRSGQLARAIETLREGLALAPKALEIREMLRDVLLESGDTRGSVDQLIEIAEILVESLNGDEAARSLQDALSLDPNNLIATRMLRDLGYELVEETADAEEHAAHEAPTAMRGPWVGYDPAAPLPSYDLEEIEPDEVGSQAPPSPGADDGPAGSLQPLRMHANIDTIDDPFGDGPLPSFALDRSQDPTESGAGQDRQPGPAWGDAGRSTIQRGIPELESALEEADFFASRGLFDDARTILQEQLSRLPNHPLLRDRLTELAAQERTAHGDSGTRPSPAAEDRVSNVVGALGPQDRAHAGVPKGFAGPAEPVDVEEVFAKFKAGVAAQIAVEDTQSHFDLGVAYREMGLLDDAIREFGLAARDPNNACVCHSMIGTIQIERGNLNEAIESFMRGLQVPDRTRDQEAALSYELGAAYEAKKMTKPALESLQRTARLVPSYRDVQERIRRLQKGEAKPNRAAAVGADEEFDRAFEDILGDRSRGA
jgi:tetratricopeptide (TPR) repeat protein